MMVDVEQTIKQIESNFGRQLTEKEKQAITLFGGFMDCIWDESDNQKENQTVKNKMGSIGHKEKGVN